jgi:predicted transcriptional regulator
LPNTSKKDDKMYLTNLIQKLEKTGVCKDDLEELMLLSKSGVTQLQKLPDNRIPANRRVLKIIFCGDSAIYKLSEPL